MKNCETIETLEKTGEQAKTLTPEVMAELVAEYPGLSDDYDEVLEAVSQMNLLVKEVEESLINPSLDDWNKRQNLVHNNLIAKVVEFIDDLEKLDAVEARQFRKLYNREVGSRLHFTAFALKFLNKN